MEMKYVFLGQTGVRVSPLCLGAMNFGLRTTEADAIPIIDRAIDAGINFIDTANVYGRGMGFSGGEGPGRSEEIVGEALKRNGKRDFVVLATKFRSEMSADDPNGVGASRRHIIEQCHASLRRLQTDHIDLYQIHYPDADVPIDETLRALDDLIRDGKVRYIGTSNFCAWQLVEAIHTSKALKLNRFVSEQPLYTMVQRMAERHLFPMTQQYKVAVLPWSPLFGGFLTGKYTRDNPPPNDSRFAITGDLESWGSVWRNPIGERCYDLLDVLTEIAEEKGCTISQLALAWTISHDAVTSAIIGPRTMTHLEDNLGALEVEISDDDKAKIDAVAKPGFTILDI